MQGDEFLLGQAIYNLLENALDFSPINSVITIKLNDYQTYRQLTVRDTGAGIPEYALNKVFDKFYSLPRPSTNQKSTGLGLNFVKEVAKLHGGSITLENHEWGGAEAILTLPKS
jgi:two-component system sensor histidine kinase CreC